MFNLAFAHSGNFCPEKFHRSGSRSHGSDHVPEQSALAATTAAHNHERVATIYVKGEIVEHGAISESPDEMVYFDDCFSVRVHALKKKIPVRIAFITNIASKDSTTEAVVD